MRKMLLILLLSGCGTAPAKEVAISCQAADYATTVYAKHIGAVEENPLIENNGILLAIKVGLAAVIATQWDNMNDFGRWVVTVLSCGPVVNNARVIQEQRRQ